MDAAIFTSSLGDTLAALLAEHRAESIHLLCDTTTHALCVPRVRALPCLQTVPVHEIVVPCGDEHKTLLSASTVWQSLLSARATRRALLLNVGGGMTTDLGGFCAACYKRGIAFVNVPTTLLAMVDASIGGKTGVNLGDIKNAIGVFCDPLCTIIDPSFLATLDEENIRSGYAEMLKHGLLSDMSTLSSLLTFDLAVPALQQLGEMIEQSVAVKTSLVRADPREGGVRAALNVGHTIGHALETLALRQRRQLLHGYAIAFGIVAELYLSATKVGFPSSTLRQVVSFIRRYYGAAPLVCADYPTLFELMTHDKKNADGQITFTLLRDVGAIALRQHASEEEICAALDFLREGL